MGSCVSRPGRCVSGRRRSAAEGTEKRRRGRRRRGIRKRVSSLKSIVEIEISEGDGDDSTSYYSNPAFQLQGSIDEAWFDSNGPMESDGEDDFHSVQDDIFPLNGYDAASVSSKSSIKDGGILDYCGILPNNCLHCLASTTPDKKGSQTSSPPHLKKKAALKLSFKWRAGEGHVNSPLFSMKYVLERPIAGTQVPFCPLEKKMMDSWSHVEPDTFRVRGVNYFRDKKKEFAPKYAAYYPFGVDVYLSPRKIDHISRFSELPSVNISSKFPSILVVIGQVPLYHATIFQNEADGEGMSVVLYFRLSESYAKELPTNFQENIRGENYLEIDLDMHRFSYISRKGFEAFLDRLKLCVLDVGLTIQGNKPEELPEQILCCVRLNGHTKYQQLTMHSANQDPGNL